LRGPQRWSNFSKKYYQIPLIYRLKVVGEINQKGGSKHV